MTVGIELTGFIVLDLVASPQSCDISIHRITSQRETYESMCVCVSHGERKYLQLPMPVA